tara:strand:- start:411 stop:1469 length:1059 start_codon:yes stop_codon:yes gene_type:complete
MHPKVQDSLNNDIHCRKRIMTIRALSLALCTVLTFAISAVAEEAKSVRMGSGVMTFETVPGWGLRPDGSSALGATHGGVVCDSMDNVYVSANKGVVVFSPEGKVIQEYLGGDYVTLHDIEIRREGDAEFIYGAANVGGFGIKFNAHTGEVVLKLDPKDSGLPNAKYAPTAITVAPNGDIYLSDGYASNIIFVYDKDGKYKFHFGEKGNELKQFNTAHGMTLDTRYDPPRILICDRNHQPKGRMLHYSLEGEFIDVVVTGLGMPTAVVVQGDYAAIPDLHGRVVILNKTNTICSILGHNDGKGLNYNVKQADWVEGVFSGTHGSYFDSKGNLYVQDWNVDGRIIKLNKIGVNN